MLSHKSLLIAGPNWIPTSMHLPDDGQSVFVRYNPEPRAVVFWRRPAARWGSRDTVYPFEYFNQWAVVSTTQGVEEATMNLADYFESRAAEYRDQLRFAEKPGFALKQVSEVGEVDVTEQHKAGLRRAIEDYDKAAAIWREENDD